MVYVMIERFKNRDPVPIYHRFRRQGRMMPDGLRYVSSWVETNWDRCFQVMECEDPRLLDEWIAGWSDLADFEIVPVVTSQQAAALIE